MTQSNCSLLTSFTTFNDLRQKEIQEAKKQLLEENLEIFAIEYNRFCNRISQALVFAELQYYKREDYFAALEQLLLTEKLDSNQAFAAFVYSRYGLPDTRWYEFEEISPSLKQWIFRNVAHFAMYDFSFSNFEEAYKEACYREHQDTVITLGD